MSLDSSLNTRISPTRNCKFPDKYLSSLGFLNLAAVCALSVELLYPCVCLVQWTVQICAYCTCTERPAEIYISLKNNLIKVKSQHSWIFRVSSEFKRIEVTRFPRTVTDNFSKCSFYVNCFLLWNAFSELMVLTFVYLFRFQKGDNVKKFREEVSVLL